jgi:predicted methyltransferase
MIVDDGSHNPTYQMDALNYLWEALKPGGVYIIEVGREAHCTA